MYRKMSSKSSKIAYLVMIRLPTYNYILNWSKQNSLVKMFIIINWSRNKNSLVKLQSRNSKTGNKAKFHLIVKTILIWWTQKKKKKHTHTQLVSSDFDRIDGGTYVFF